ncbi:hypothetical protein L6452_08770 [Arctium lappa]|uniref:Uncharacterized protein n=1 Tax=Arctium lappa TaxID=4217 RepID=A0ACB9DII7_ARCLA|nr:hypothetical protein L6452_08770 [Arctium lappa]
MVSVTGNVGGRFAAAGEDGDDGWIDRDEILQVAKEKEKELMVEMINPPATMRPTAGVSPAAGGCPSPDVHRSPTNRRAL